MPEQNSPEQLLRGLSFEPLPEGWTPVAAIVMVKCLDENGRPTWSFRTTDGMNDEELLGALVVRTELQRQSLIDAYTQEDEG